MPNRSELEEQFGASTVTVQRAFNTLIEDGFIDVRGVRGSYVSAKPPHLCNYALVLPQPSDMGSQFWMALCNEAAKVTQSGSRRILIYHDVNGHGHSDNERRLIADIRAHRLAGLVFLFAPFALAGSPVLTEPGVERVALRSKVFADGISSVWVDEKALIQRALSLAAGRGRRRVAVLRNSCKLAPDSFWHRWSELVASHGLETRPYWHLPLSMLDPIAIRQTVHLLMNPRQEERPDVLIVADDNLLEAATTGLIAARSQVPQDLDVIAHANFPLPTKSHGVPAIRLGFSTCVKSWTRPSTPSTGVAAVVRMSSR